MAMPVWRAPPCTSTNTSSPGASAATLRTGRSSSADTALGVLDLTTDDPPGACRAQVGLRLCAAAKVVAAKHEQCNRLIQPTAQKKSYLMARHSGSPPAPPTLLPGAGPTSLTVSAFCSCRESRCPSDVTASTMTCSVEHMVSLCASSWARVVSSCARSRACKRPGGR
eukprot:356623-Chlamydomonas_euryale.AAC.5